jgi:ubiquinone/menaquinone biosynthesis C-methylase UbiE
MSVAADFVPALGIRAPPSVYEAVVELFCRDDHVKRLLLQRIAAAHTADDRPLHILDVACGPGKLARLLGAQQHCCTVSAFDIDPAMVERAAAETAGHDNVTVALANVCALPLGDALCDVAIESLLFHHLTDEQKATATAEIARVLKVDGTFYFVDWVKPVGVWSQIAFNVVKWLDGAANVAAHEDNRVFDIVGQHFSACPDTAPTLIQTSVGTLAIAAYKRKPLTTPI